MWPLLSTSMEWWWWLIYLDDGLDRIATTSTGRGVRGQIHLYDRCSCQPTFCNLSPCGSFALFCQGCSWYVTLYSVDKIPCYLDEELGDQKHLCLALSFLVFHPLFSSHPSTSSFSWSWWSSPSPWVAHWRIINLITAGGNAASTACCYSKSPTTTNWQPGKSLHFRRNRSFWFGLAHPPLTMY